MTLNLSGCFNLKKIPQFVGNMKCLQEPFLDCIAIMELPSSIEGLIGLTSLTLRDCKNLMCLPSTICNLKSLESLDLSWCSTFEYLPENLGNVKGLKKLDLSGIAIKELPSTIEGLISLTLLTLKDCENLACLPSTISSLKSLKSLDLSRCSKLDNLPENLGSVVGLKELKLSGTSIKELPSSIERLTSLTLLTLRDCKNLVCLPNAIWSLKMGDSLDLVGCTKIDKLPENLGNIEGLEKLDLSGTGIKEFPSSIECLTSLTKLTLRDCKVLVCLPNAVWGLKLVNSLDLAGCTKFENLLENLGNVEGLEKLDLSGTAIKKLPSSIEHLTNLTKLTLSDCKNLVCLPNAIWSLKLGNSLDLSGCSKFDNLTENLGNVEGLEKLDLSGAAIKELPSSIEHLTSLTLLTLKDCKNLMHLPNNIWNLK